jgi:ATP-binding cassette, subfamily C (CFTR/MRP), member 1
MQIFEILSHTLEIFFSVLTCAYYFTNEFGCAIALYAVMMIMSMQFTLKRIRSKSVSRKEHS